MECHSCSRSSHKLTFYCQSCLTTRLAEHYSLRQALKRSLLGATAKAAAILYPPPSVGPSGASGRGEMGVEEERELKAEKWERAVRLRDVRVVLEKQREQVEADRAVLATRREAVAQRRANLTQGRALLASLSGTAAHPTSPSSTPPTYPDSHAALEVAYAILQRRSQEVLQRTAETRMILTRELLSVYAFAPVDRPLPSPFTSTSPSSSSSSSSSTSSLFEPHPTYSIATLPLPHLSTIPLQPSTILAASLSYLLHLVRLLALYLGLTMPYNPLPSLFGPGRPGVRASVGWGDSAEPARFPVFPSRATGSKVIKEPGGEQSGGRELEGAMREKERREDRMKAVVGGAVGLAFDLAYIAWRRGADVSVDELGDLGALVVKAVGTTMGTPSSSTGPLNRARPTSLRATTRLPSAVFPLDFAAVLANYTTPSKIRLLSQATTTKRASGDAEEEEWDWV